MATGPGNLSLWLLRGQPYRPGRARISPQALRRRASAGHTIRHVRPRKFWLVPSSSEKSTPFADLTRETVAELDNKSRRRAAAEKRNSSVLAHGVKAIGEDGFIQIKLLAPEFLGFDPTLE